MKLHLLKILILLLILNDNHRAQVVALQDDWYSYVSFEDVSNWHNTYLQLCTRQKFDIYREPRIQSNAEDLRALREAVSPIIIEDEETVKSPDHITLHIYNNAGIRQGYSLSYGFQRNKECLHAQDADCIVMPEFGRVRALVVNADRYPNGQNLNYIKDHFQIEEPERFVTILNGGSVFERKFYEAVFLGGLKETGDPRRTSHQINGVSYPMEIYMFFVDETVPSVTLSTVLVVLVEESKRDNPHIKPLVSTVENKLYNEERKFLNKHKYMVRRERLFHHLDKSTQFDIYHYDKFKAQTNFYGKEKRFLQKTIDPSREHEPSFAEHVEAYEKMQALEATLFFTDEDLHNIDEASSKWSTTKENFFDRKGNEFFPLDPPPVKGKAQPHELHFMAMAALSTELLVVLQNTPCYKAVNHMMKENKANPYVNGYFEFAFTHGRPWNESTTILIPEGDKTTHFGRVLALTKIICQLYLNYQEFEKINKNAEKMKQIPFEGRPANEELSLNQVDGKYDLIKDYRDLRLFTEDVDQEMYKHLYENKEDHDPADVDAWGWAEEYHKHKFASSVVGLGKFLKKTQGYDKIKTELIAKVQAEVDRLHFPNEQTMRQVIHFLKFGDKGNTAKYRRDELHDQFTTNYLPVQQKRRGLVELGNMEMTEEEIAEAEVLSPIRAKVDQSFQISWLIPHTGGYYHYEGTSPVPPCFRVQNTIVFKKPIKMSKYQIDILTRIPSSFNKARDLLSTTPIIQDTRFLSELRSTFSMGQRYEEVKVAVYNQERNHLFLGHDGVHKNAVEEYEKHSKSKSSTGVPAARPWGVAKMGGVVLLTFGIPAFLIGLFPSK